MGATSYRERHALQVHQRINAEIERDPFDQDYDPTEVPTAVVDRNSESFLPANPPQLPSIDRQEAHARLAAAKALIRVRGSAKEADEARKSLQYLRCWRDASKSVRFMIVRAAGLPGEVVDKIDRDLTESEKALIRAAAKRLRDLADSLTKI